MVDQPFIEKHYFNKDRQVVWTGLSLSDGEEFNQFLTIDVAARINDEEERKAFESHLQSLASTGFEQDNLHALLDASSQENRDWAIGEALAEVHLGNEFEIEWPWNTERDKRTPMASLPGADLVGLMTDEKGALLVLGEVKCSSELKNPPQVMYGRSGMIHQLDLLADNLSLLSSLLRWLFLRCRGTKYEGTFDLAMKRLLQSRNRDLAMFGVLIRDTVPTARDLVARGRCLADRIYAPTHCTLIALHLPCSIRNLPERLRGGES